MILYHPSKAKIWFVATHINLMQCNITSSGTNTSCKHAHVHTLFLFILALCLWVCMYVCVCVVCVCVCTCTCQLSMMMILVTLTHFQGHRNLETKKTVLFSVNWMWVGWAFVHVQHIREHHWDTVQNQWCICTVLNAYLLLTVLVISPDQYNGSIILSRTVHMHYMQCLCVSYVVLSYLYV